MEGASGAVSYRVAIYARLSKEKEETIERGTIENQINMVRDFVCRQSDMEIADIYVDDSVSGTRFDRPGFDRLIADMKKGLFNTIAVKDDCEIIGLNQKNPVNSRV